MPIPVKQTPAYTTTPDAGGGTRVNSSGGGSYISYPASVGKSTSSNDSSSTQTQPQKNPIKSPATDTTTNPATTPAPVLPPGQSGNQNSNPVLPSAGEARAATKQLSQTTSDLQNSELSAEDYAVKRSQSLLDEIAGSYTSELDQAKSNSEGAAIASGQGGSPAAASSEYMTMKPILDKQKAAVDSQILSIRQNAASTFETLNTTANSNAEKTLASFQAGQKDLQSSVTQMASVGYTAAQLKETNPDEYKYLLEYGFNGDENAMNALFLSGSKATLLNSGNPVISTGTTQVYGQMTMNADGTPGIKYTTVKLPEGLPVNYKISSFNQAANGQIAYLATPIDANGNAILDPSKPNNGVITGFFGNPNTAPGGGSTPDTSGKTGSINSATGLSIQAFNFLTQGTSALSRLSASQRTAIMNEAETWANKNGIDLSTFQSQYTAYNDVLQSNIKRFSNTTIAENELTGTLTNLSSTISDAELSGLKPADVAKIFAGQQVNDPTAQKYSFFLSQLRNEVSLYYAASQGKASPDVIDNQDAAETITNGISSGSVAGLQSAITSSTEKMKKVLQSSVDSANKSVWGLFGVGDEYNPANAGNPGTSGSTTSSTSSSGGSADQSMQPSGTIVEDGQGNKYVVGSDGVSLTPYSG